MDRISAWIDEKPHRFQLMLLANTAAAPSCLRWPVSEATRPRMGSGAGGKSKRPEARVLIRPPPPGLATKDALAIGQGR